MTTKEELEREISFNMEYGCPSVEMALQFISEHYDNKEVRKLAKEWLNKGENN